MKAVFSLLVLAGLAIANVPAQLEKKNYYPDTTTTMTTYTTTTYCPVTTTTIEKGTTKVITKMTTSTLTITSCVYGCQGATVTVPGPTVYTTSTSLCPVTETSIISGKPVYVTWTSTSLIVDVVKTIIPVYTTYLTTAYATTQVYATTTCYESAYTTVSAGSTIVITDTLTSTYHVTSKYIITTTLEPPTTKATVFVPITLATSVPVYETVTIPSEKTATLPGGTIYSTVAVPSSTTVTKAPPTTTLPPTTVVTSISTNTTTSAPVQVSNNAAATMGVKGWGVAGVVAVLALV